MRGFQPGRRRNRGGCLLKLLFLAGLLAAVAVAAWVVVVPGLIVAGLEARTGFSVQARRLALNPWQARVEVEGLIVRNPDGWPGRDFLDVRRAVADLELWPLLLGRIEAAAVELDVAQVTLVKDAAGRLNAVVFKEALLAGADAGSLPRPPPAPKGKGAAPAFLIHRLTLRFDRLVYADHSGARPAVSEYNLGIRRDLREVDSVVKLLSPFDGAALRVVGDALRGMFRRDPRVLEDVTKFLEEAGKKTGETLKGLWESLEKLKPQD